MKMYRHANKIQKIGLIFGVASMPFSGLVYDMGQTDVKKAKEALEVIVLAENIADKLERVATIGASLKRLTGKEFQEKSAHLGRVELVIDATKAAAEQKLSQAEGLKTTGEVGLGIGALIVASSLGGMYYRKRKHLATVTPNVDLIRIK